MHGSPHLGSRLGSADLSERRLRRGWASPERGPSLGRHRRREGPIAEHVGKVLGPAGWGPFAPQVLERFAPPPQ
eukprot:9280817-Lingulodinium_polyedra.AAC.1